VTTETGAFPVTWDDPADAEQCWRFSAEHMPNAVPPLEFELGTKRFLEGFGWGMVPKQFNYYIYFAFDPAAAGPTPPEVTPAAMREAGRRWWDEVLPEVLQHIERYRAPDFAAMTNEQLAQEIEALPDVRYRSGQLHTLAIQPHWRGTSLLIDTYKELTGGDDLGALRLVQGYGNKSFESSERLWRVARIAAGIPLVRERVLAMDPANAPGTLAALRDEPAAAPFVEAFDAYLDEYGWRSNAGLGVATWYEDPTVPLMLLRAHLETEGYDPNEEQRRLIEERETFTRQTLASLDDAGRARLQDAIDAAVAVAPLLEDHNFFIDQRLACMPRRLILAAAARLGLAYDNDVFFLHADELCAVLRGRQDGIAARIEERKREFARWRDVSPPDYVGAPPPEGAAQEGSPRATEQGGDLRGVGVSPGVVRGPARILRSMAEADRLRPGDVLVTSVTQPAWTPLFGIARAVVTEVGGMLSHTAVASREFGIPAIVALLGATRLLRDGQLVEVDGSTGEVRVVG
jgi:pyruvate,water dikinase